MAKYVIKGLDKIFKDGFKYKKAGVIAMDIVPENPNQTTLFDKLDKRHESLMKTMDLINNSLGVHKVKLGSQDLSKTWKMKQEKLSPRYTTQLSEIMTVNI